MTVSFRPPDTEAAREAGEALELTGELYRIAVEELNEAFAAIRAGRFAEAKEAKRAVRDLADLSKALLEERRNVERLRRQIAGEAAGGAALDLGAARDEIGRRLARLRGSGGD